MTLIVPTGQTSIRIITNILNSQVPLEGLFFSVMSCFNAYTVIKRHREESSLWVVLRNTLKISTKTTFGCLNIE
jgi:hypothetical protein